MNQPVETDNHNGDARVKELIEAEEGISRKPEGGVKYLIPAIAIAWSVFQLSIAWKLTLDIIYVRAIHLGFTMLIVFLNYPALKKKRFGLDFLSAKTRIPVIDIVFAIVAALSALYIAIDYEGMTTRYGLPIVRDLVIGIVLVILLMEATRRVIGLTLPVIAFIFILYAFLGPYMPEVIAFKGVSLNRFVGQMSMSTEGIYGIPLPQVHSGAHRPGC